MNIDLQQFIFVATQGQAGLEPGSFRHALITAWFKADLENQRKLRSVFPELGAAYDRFMKGERD